MKIRGKRYYQGISKESFFGDRADENRNGEVFNFIDKYSIGNRWIVAARVDNYVPNDEKSLDFVKKSKTNGYYDFKNNVLTINPETNKKYDNHKTAYLINGYLVNRNEAGNILWGAAGAKVGLPPGYLKWGANMFTLIDEGEYDEPSEQFCIDVGWNAFMMCRPENVIKQ